MLHPLINHKYTCMLHTYIHMYVIHTLYIYMYINPHARGGETWVLPGAVLCINNKYGYVFFFFFFFFFFSNIVFLYKLYPRPRFPPPPISSFFFLHAVYIYSTWHMVPSFTTLIAEKTVCSSNRPVGTYLLKCHDHNP